MNLLSDDLEEDPVAYCVALDIANKKSGRMRI